MSIRAFPLSATLLDRAPRKQGDDRLIRLVAGITAAPGRALLQIAAQLEACTSVCRVAERGGNLSGICSPRRCPRTLVAARCGAQQATRSSSSCGSGVLFLGGDSRIANQTAWQGGLRQFCRHEFTGTGAFWRYYKSTGRP
jgi:hypothetical protein